MTFRSPSGREIDVILAPAEVAQLLRGGIAAPGLEAVPGSGARDLSAAVLRIADLIDADA
jgi:hypothetical protein